MLGLQKQVLRLFLDFFVCGLLRMLTVTIPVDPLAAWPQQKHQDGDGHGREHYLHDNNSNDDHIIINNNNNDINIYIYIYIYIHLLRWSRVAFLFEWNLAGFRKTKLRHFKARGSNPRTVALTSTCRLNFQSCQGLHPFLQV